MTRPRSAPAPLFFYGTLMDLDVLSAVIGRRVSAAACRPAEIEDYHRVRRAGTSYPVLVPEPGRRVGGILVGGLTVQELARLVAFEGDDYDIAEVETHTGGGRTISARTFLPRPGVPATSDVWTPDVWRRRHKSRYLQRLQRFGCGSPD